MTATYPANTISFASKVDFVDTVLAAHVNSLQEEVTALEDNLGTYIRVSSGWSGSFDQSTVTWDSLKDRLANIEYGLSTAYSSRVNTAGGSIIQAGAVGTTSLIVRALASQSSNLVEFQTSASTVVSRVAADGVIYTSGKALVPIVYASSQPSSVPAGTIWVNSASNVAQLNPTSGVPAGGTTNQFLIKTSSSDYATSWTSTPTFSSISNTGTLTLPTSTDTLVGRATSDTLTNKTFDTAGTGNSFKINGTTINAVNGSGAAVLTTSPTLITPALGVATATSLNKVTVTAPATSATLTLVDGSTLATSGAYSTTLTATAATNVTLPTTGTLATLSGAETLANKIFTAPRETISKSATAATGTVNVDVKSYGVYYYTANASANWTFNLRGDGSTTLNDLLTTGTSVSVAFMVTNGTSAYYPSTIKIDGTTVTPKWQGGVAPTGGNVSSVDSYSFVVFKNADTDFTVFASQTKFA